MSNTHMDARQATRFLQDCAQMRRIRQEVTALAWSALIGITFGTLLAIAIIRGMR